MRIAALVYSFPLRPPSISCPQKYHALKRLGGAGSPASRFLWKRRQGFALPTQSFEGRVIMNMAKKECAFRVSGDKNQIPKNGSNRIIF